MPSGSRMLVEFVQIDVLHGMVVVVVGGVFVLVVVVNIMGGVPSLEVVTFHRAVW